MSRSSCAWGDAHSTPRATCKSRQTRPIGSRPAIRLGPKDRVRKGLDTRSDKAAYSVITEMHDKTNTTVAPIATPWRVVLPGGSGHLGKILARVFSCTRA